MLDLQTDIAIIPLLREWIATDNAGCVFGGLGSQPDNQVKHSPQPNIVRARTLPRLSQAVASTVEQLEGRTLLSTVLFNDTFDVSANSLSVNFEHAQRQSGILGATTYTEPGLDWQSQVGHANAANALRLSTQDPSNKYAYVSPNRNFNSNVGAGDRLIIEFRVNPLLGGIALNDPTQPSWAGIKFGSAGKNQVINGADGFGLLFRGEGDRSFKAFNGATAVAEGTYTSSTADAYHDVRIELKSANPQGTPFDGSDVVVTAFCDGAQLFSYTKTGGFASNHMTLQGYANKPAADGTSRVHGIDDFKVSSDTPILSARGSDLVLAGTEYRLSLSTSDPDATSAWHIDWGDGSPAETIAGSATEAVHTFASDFSGTATPAASATVGGRTYNVEMIAPTRVLDPETTLYFNDFGYDPDGGSGSDNGYVANGSASLNQSSATDFSKTPKGGRKFWGEFGNENAVVTLNGLPEHTQLTVSFDVFVIRSWDGNYAQNNLGPDHWRFGVDGERLIDTTFSNKDITAFPTVLEAMPQAYPDGAGGSHPAWTGASETQALGYSFTSSTGSYQGMDSVYRITRVIEHDGSTLALDFSALGLQGLADESWGIDNIVVKADRYRIGDVEWVGVKAADDKTNLSEDNLAAQGGGFRIIPDKNEGGANGVTHRRVNVRATLDRAVAEGEQVDVFFRIFDVDDPASNDDLDPNDNTGASNKGGDNVGGLGMAPAVGEYLQGSILKATIPAGQQSAEVEYVLTGLNPGNNFKVFADLDLGEARSVALDEKKENGKTSVNSFKLASGEPAPQERSTSTLAVWRALHVETDRMGAIGPTGVSGGLDTGVEQVAYNEANDRSVVIVGLGGLQARGFENGKLWINGNEYPIISSQALTTRTGFAVPGRVVAEQGTAWVAVDDDATSYAGVDAGQVPAPETGKLEEAFRPAYIQIRFVEAANSVDSAFDENVEHAELEDRIKAKKQLETESDYWTVTILGAYQGIETEDHDQNSERGEYGYAPGLKEDIFTGLNGVAVYAETLRDASVQAGFATAEETAAKLKLLAERWVVHEIGHCFGLEHADTRGGDVMTTEIDMTAAAWNAAKYTFSDFAIKKMRGNDAMERIGSEVK